MKGLLRLWLLALGILFGTGAMALPVKAVTSSTGERVAIQDIPEYRDTPWKIHRRYCAEPATIQAVWSSVLTPNGITNDRRMPAGEVLTVRCKELKKAWKLLLTGNENDKELLSALRNAQAELAAMKTELRSFQLSLERLPQTLQANAPLSPQAEPPWWHWGSHWFWTYLLLILLIVALAGIATVLYRTGGLRRRNEGYSFEEPGSFSHDREFGHSPLWIGQSLIDPGATDVYVVAYDPQGRYLKLFQYHVVKDTNGAYRLMRGGTTQNLDELAEDVKRTLDRCLQEPGIMPETSYIERARQDKRLNEISLSKTRPKA